MTEQSHFIQPLRALYGRTEHEKINASKPKIRIVEWFSYSVRLFNDPLSDHYALKQRVWRKKFDFGERETVLLGESGSGGLRR